MKNPNRATESTTYNNCSTCNICAPASPGLLIKTAILAIVGFVSVVQAGNVLQNPGFESGSGLANWSAREDQTWPIGPASGQGKLYHSGNNSLWMQGEYGNTTPAGQPNLIYEYQTSACAAGSTFSADAFFSQYVNHDSTVHEGGDNGTSGLFTADGSGQEDGWVEVAFLDSGNHILADYRSAILDPAYVNNLVSIGAITTNGAQTYLAWLDCFVTNQYDVSQIPAGAVDPDTYASAITNTLAPGQYMVAPPGTVNVQFRLALYQTLYESGATYWDDATLNLVGGPAPSVIGNVSPDGSHFFNTASSFSFTVTSASSGGAPLPNNPTNGIKVLVNGKDQSASLQFSGNLQNWNVSLPITSNQLYNVSITVSNSAGLTTTDNLSFDTFNTNAFVIYTEDYDFNGGQFIQSPVPTNDVATNSYWGTAGTPGIDINYNGGGSTLAPAYPNRTDNAVDFQVATDLQMPLFTAQSNSAIYNVNISYNNGGNWLNYTRNPYPSGPSVVFARISGGAGRGVEYLNILTSGYGTSTQTTNNLGQFVLANGTDWGAYQWIPLTDSLGNIAVINIPSGQQTLQLLSGGGENVIDFLIVPAGGVALPPVIANLNPPIATQNIFLGGTTNITFTVSSSQSTIATSNIVVTLNGTAVPATFTGNGTNWNVSVAIPQNQVLALGVSATAADGLSKSITDTFDTFSQNNYMFEAEDYDFAGGQFIDDPVPTTSSGPAANSYYYYPEGNGANSAIVDVDYTTSVDAGETYLYRPLDYAGTEVTSDALRQKFVVAGQTNSDYDIGWWNPGQWFNYTRTYPTGTYYVYGRLAGGAPYTGVTLSMVTSGVGTSNQTTQVLGTFSDSTANGWQNWHWVPLLATNGQVATVTLGGVQTLRVTSGTGQNANFYMLVSIGVQPPKLSASVAQGKIVIQIPTQMNSNYTVLYNNSLTGGTWQPLGSAIPGTGGTITVSNSIPTAPGQQFYKVLVQ